MSFSYQKAPFKGGVGLSGGLLGGIFGSLFLFLLPLTAWGQMTFSYAVEPVSLTTQADGSTLVTFPAGTSLQGVIKGTLVDGKTAVPSFIIPNPQTTVIRDGELETFVYQGKAYSFRFTAPEDESKIFKVIIFSDPHIEHGSYDATSVGNMQTYVRNMVAMKPAIVFCLGDMDQDSEFSGNNFRNAVQGFLDAGIPFITMCGNHDLVPDYWEGGDYGVTYGIGNNGGHNANVKALNMVTSYLNEAKKYGVGVEVIKDKVLQSSAQQFSPFVVTFRGMNFYCGQTFWFQKPYTIPGLFDIGKKATYWAPDDVIESLAAFVRNHADMPSVWMQHYPLVAGSDCDRWWLSECKPGTIPPANGTAYATPRAMKLKYSQLINLTRNPVHFSGHTHNFAQNTYEGITDYTAAGMGRVPGAAYVVTCKEGVGVIKVEQACFN
ncbi:MAG: metallophosphoesterase [Bacteroidaceae bacterium]|nr:metallophosphoesterase [Bacteroidaceae bacterium]